MWSLFCFLCWPASDIQDLTIFSCNVKMMLIINGKVRCENATLKIDDYVPFDIEFGSAPSIQLYWSGGNGRVSLIEIGIDKENGAVSSATLVIIHPEYMRETETPLNNEFPETDGIPVFDIRKWGDDIRGYSDRFLDDFCTDISLLIGGDYITVFFYGADKASHYIRNGEIRFGVSQKGELSALEILNLSPEQIEVIKRSS